MFFNTDILYRNGPLALIWLAGNGDSVMKSGPSRTKYKTDIMREDLHRAIALIFEQLPSVGSDNGLSLKKIACLFHGIVVVHHMQLDASLKRLNQLYIEACKMRDLITEEIDIDTVVPDCTDLIPNLPKGRSKKLLNTSSDFQLQEMPMSVRALPQPTSEVSGFEVMIDDETWFEEESRRNKRKEDNVDVNDETPAKLPKHMRCIRETIGIGHKGDSQTFPDWDISAPEELPSFCPPIEDDPPPPVVTAPILEDNHHTSTSAVTKGNTTGDLELDLDRGDRDLSPVNRTTTDNQNFPPLRRIQEDVPQRKKQPKPKFITFNEDTELSNETIRRQVSAALGIDGFGPKFLELQKRASSLHARSKAEYLRSLRGIKFIENAGRKPTADSVLLFLKEIHSQRKNFRSEVSVEELRAGPSRADDNISKDSRAIATTSLISLNISNAREKSPPLNSPQVLEVEMMETMADQDIPHLPEMPDEHPQDIPHLPEMPDENPQDIPHLPEMPDEHPQDIPHLPEMPDEHPQGFGNFNELRQDMALFSAKLPLNQDYLPKKSSDTIDEKFLLASLSRGEAIFSEILPSAKCNRLQAAQGLMLLLRMQGEKKITMTQTHSKNDYDYGPIHVNLLIAKK